MASLRDASFYCITELELPTNVTGTNTNYRIIYSSVSLTSAGFGFIGSVVQLICWIINTRNLQVGEQRRAFVNPVIVICLAVANLLSCMGVVVRSTGIMFTNPPSKVCMQHRPLPTCGNNLRFDPTVCQKTMILGSIFESFTDFSFLAAVFWTCAYSADVLRRQRHIVLESQTFKNRSTTSYHMICWGFPLLFVAGSVFIIYFDTGFPSRCPDELRTQLRCLVVYFPVVIVMLVNPILLIKSRILVRKSITRLTATYSSRERDAVRKVTYRFIGIIVMFTACWLPNITESLTQVIISQYYSAPHETYQWLFPLLIFESVLNPLQGFYNCFIYGLPGFFTTRCCKHKDSDILSASLEESQSLLSSKTGSLQRHCTLT